MKIKVYTYNEQKLRYQHLSTAHLVIGRLIIAKGDFTPPDLPEEYLSNPNPPYALFCFDKSFPIVGDPTKYVKLNGVTENIRTNYGLRVMSISKLCLCPLEGLIDPQQFLYKEKELILNILAGRLMTRSQHYPSNETKEIWPIRLNCENNNSISRLSDTLAGLTPGGMEVCGRVRDFALTLMFTEHRPMKLNLIGNTFPIKKALKAVKEMKDLNEGRDDILSGDSHRIASELKELYLTHYCLNREPIPSASFPPVLKSALPLLAGIFLLTSIATLQSMNTSLSAIEEEQQNTITRLTIEHQDIVNYREKKQQDIIDRREREQQKAEEQRLALEAHKRHFDPANRFYADPPFFRLDPKKEIRIRQLNIEDADYIISNTHILESTVISDIPVWGSFERRQEYKESPLLIPQMKYILSSIESARAVGRTSILVQLLQYEDRLFNNAELSLMYQYLQACDFDLSNILEGELLLINF